MTREDEKILTRMLLYLQAADTGFILAEVNEPERISNIISYIKETLSEKKILSIDLQDIPGDDTHLGKVKTAVKNNPACEVVLIQNLHTLAGDSSTGNIGLVRDLNLCREPYANLNKLIVFFFPIFFVDLMYKHALDFLDWIPMKFKFEPEKSLAFERLNPEREFADERFVRNRISYLESTIKEGEVTDEDKAARIFEIAVGYRKLYNHEKALELFNKCLELSLKLRNRNLEGYLPNEIGIIYLHTAQYNKALRHFQDGLNSFREINDKKGEGSTLNNIARVYQKKSDYENALKYFEQALTINKEISYRIGEGATLNNIGGVLDAQGKYNEAMEKYTESLEIKKEVGDRQGIATSLNNIGNVLNAQGSYKEAMEKYKESLEISKEIGDRQGIATSLNNIGEIYYKRNNFPMLSKALTYFLMSCEIEIDMGIPDQNTVNYIKSTISKLKSPKESDKILNSFGQDFRKKLNQYMKG